VRTCADYAGALRLLRRRAQDPAGFPKALTVSALEETGLAEAWAEMRALAEWRRGAGHWQALRAGQARRWFEAEVRHGLMAALETAPARAEMARLGEAVAAGRVTPEAAAAAMLARLAGRA
jgi:LAO/AO transport system kinase